MGALAQVVVKWRDGASNAPLGEFPTSNVMIITLSEPLADGDAVITEFSGLTPATIYAVLVQGVNVAGISSTNFAMETASKQSHSHIFSFTTVIIILTNINIL